MADFAVCVTFRVAPEDAERFVDQVRAQAEASLREAGCRVFDVWTDPGRPGTVFLYEIYDDAAAFDLHLGTAHFRDFDASTRAVVLDKHVVTWPLKETRA